jgi:hypothetical protein
MKCLAHHNESQGRAYADANENASLYASWRQKKQKTAPLDLRALSRDEDSHCPFSGIDDGRLDILLDRLQRHVGRTPAARHCSVGTQDLLKNLITQVGLAAEDAESPTRIHILSQG